MGTYTFILMGYRLKQAWLDDDNPIEAIEHAGWVLTALLYWRYWLHEREKNPDRLSSDHYTVKQHHMTRETFLDSIISCSTRVLVFILYRGEEDEEGNLKEDRIAESLRQWKPIGNRLSSRFSEYIFQYVRMQNTNTPAMGAHAALQHLKHYWAQMRMNARAAFSLPHSRRTPKSEINLKDGLARSRADPEYWAGSTNEKIRLALDRAMANARLYFQEMCKFDIDLNLQQRGVFFSAPCKHFPRMEVFTRYMDPVGCGDSGDGGDGGGDGDGDEEHQDPNSGLLPIDIVNDARSLPCHGIYLLRYHAHCPIADRLAMRMKKEGLPQLWMKLMSVLCLRKCYNGIMTQRLTTVMPMRCGAACQTLLLHSIEGNSQVNIN